MSRTPPLPVLAVILAIGAVLGMHGASGHAEVSGPHHLHDSAEIAMAETVSATPTHEHHRLRAAEDSPHPDDGTPCRACCGDHATPCAFIVVADGETPSVPTLERPQHHDAGAPTGLPTGSPDPPVPRRYLDSIP